MVDEKMVATQNHMDLYCQIVIAAYTKTVERYNFNPDGIILKVTYCIKKKSTPLSKYTPSIKNDSRDTIFKFVYTSLEGCYILRKLNSS